MNYYARKTEVTAKLQRFLQKRGFQEVHTPILRRDAGQLIKRIQLKADFPYALRDSHELQLRWLLTMYDSVFEIGSCFRVETSEKSATNSGEFLLMELFTTKYDIQQIQQLVRQFILSLKPDVFFEEISIADYIREHLDIDLLTESQEMLFQRLKQSDPTLSFEHDYEYVLHYIETEIEPLSKGKVVFFTDYPECTCSYADIKQGAVIRRFELFANGLELANGFDDECNAARFRARNASCPIFPQEEQAIADALETQKLPAVSAGVGIGIERLCMFLYGIDDIKMFSYISDAF